MSAVVESGGSGKRGAASQDFELNLASIIDALTVLIAFMLISSSFISIGIIDAGVAAAGSQATSETPPDVNVLLELNKDKKMVLKVSGKTHQSTTIEPKDGKYDYTQMNQTLSGIKEKWKSVNAVTLIADESIEYREVVATMDSMRKSVPVVLLGGF